MTGLEDLYREIILDHYRSPRNRGELPAPPAHRVEGFNPLCGDEVVVYVRRRGRHGDATSASPGQGCSISQSSASLMSAAVKGKSVAEARDLIRTFKAMMSVHEARLGDGPTAPGPATDRRRALRRRSPTPSPSASSPPCRAWSSSRSASSAPRCRGTPWPRASTRPSSDAPPEPERRPSNGRCARRGTGQQGVGLNGPVPGTRRRGAWPGPVRCRSTVRSVGRGGRHGAPASRRRRAAASRRRRGRCRGTGVIICVGGGLLDDLDRARHVRARPQRRQRSTS